MKRIVSVLMLTVALVFGAVGCGGGGNLGNVVDDHDEKFDSLQKQIDELNNLISGLTSGDVVVFDDAELKEIVAALQKQIDDLVIAINNLGGDVVREQGAPALIFTGNLDGSAPTLTDGVISGDFYIDLDKVSDKHTMWVYTTDGWIEFGSIYTPGPAGPVRVVRL